VKFFQHAHRLITDGVAGPQTKIMLERESALHGHGVRDGGLNSAGPCHSPDMPGPDDGTFSARLGPVTTTAAARSPTQRPATDLVVQLTTDSISDALAAAYSGGAPVVKVPSADALQALLASKKNVGRLVIVSHATSDGDVRFDIGTAVSTVKLSDLAAKLRRSATVQEIVFLGCTVGKDPDGLADIKQALNAVSSEGTDCHLITKTIGPLTADGAPIDSEQKYEALSAKAKAVYNAALRERAQQGPNRGECLVGLQPNRKLKDLTDDQLRGFAMANGGMLITHFTEEDGTCWKDLKFGGPGRCHRVQK
jgi:hypothetical protein